ncbi:hypothetical protein [Candidatus Aalborgicola defluviihabitans]|uniref:hypothetical protein n=1 Tax=Candidatus Aalborgicola defluviihabitans TaxID=3386187 RepID=UPI001DA62EAD|nr:hypothetical protein [Burkholderiales bacterium]
MRKLAEATTEGVVFHHNGVVTDVNMTRCRDFARPDLYGHCRAQHLETFILSDGKHHRRVRTVHVRDPYEAAVYDTNGVEIPVESVVRNDAVQRAARTA